MVVGLVTTFGASLPQPLTSLVGREADVAAVRARLLDADVRLLTLTGPPGVGKTRLAIEVAAGLREHFDNGVVLVELAPLLTAEAVLPAIARTLGMQDVEGIPPLEALRERFGGRHVLLVLDNFEHVLAAAPGIVALLEACPRLTGLVTSRAVLRVRGEREFPVTPLALPAVDSSRESGERGAAGGSETRLYESPAVALFVERAADVRPGLALTAENAATIVEICRRLDGLPLALELAAARVRVLPPDALLERLASRLDLLTEGARDLPERQQTLRGAIAWSYELLTPEEQRLFQRLAVFADGCTLAAAEAVCGAAGDIGVGLLEGMTSLLDKSLLTQRGGPDGEPRFGMLETVREFALAALAASGEADALARRHATYSARLAAAAGAGLGTADVRTWMLRLDGELHNLRLALRWCLAEHEIDLAANVLQPLELYWQTRGLVGEARRWAEELLDLPESGTRSAGRARLLRVAGVMAQGEGDTPTARERLAESLEIWRELDDAAGLAGALRMLGWVLLEQVEEAEPLLAEAVVLFRQLDDTRNLAYAYNHLATMAMLRQDDATAAVHAEESARLFRVARDVLGGLAPAGSLALLAERRGDHATARALWERRLDGCRQTGDRYYEAATLVYLGLLWFQQGDAGEAVGPLVEGLALGHQLGSVEIAVGALEVIAGVASVQGDPARAARTFGAAEALRERHGVLRAGTHQRLYEAMVAAVRIAVGAEAFAGAWAAGRALSLDEAIADASEIAVKPTEPPVRIGTLDAALPDGLSAREVEVLALLAEGRSNREIANVLVLSVRTVEHHLARIYAKINARGRADAAAYAVRHHLLSPTEPPN